MLTNASSFSKKERRQSATNAPQFAHAPGRRAQQNAHAPFFRHGVKPGTQPRQRDNGMLFIWYRTRVATVIVKHGGNKMV